MADYVLLDPDNKVVKTSAEYTAFAPTVPVKEGYRWLPVVVDMAYTANPLLVPSTTIIVGPDKYTRRVDGVRRPEAEQIALVREEARRRILARYQDWKQTNMVARGVELQDVRRLAGSWTPEEEAESNALAAAWAWVKSVRAASNLIERMSPIPTDFSDDRYWPS